MASYVHYLSIYTRFKIIDLVFGAPDPKKVTFWDPFLKIDYKVNIKGHQD